MAVAPIVMPDQRVIVATDYSLPPKGSVEQSVLALDAAHWRNSLDIFANPNGNSNAVNALVRVYALTRGTRSEVARGRIQDQASPVHPVVRLRGQGCESYEVTVQRDYINTDAPQNPLAQISLALVAHGTQPTSDGDIPTVKTRSVGYFKVALANTPARLYSAAAVAKGGVDFWLMFFDSKGGFVPDGTVPTIPPLYMPASGIGAGSINFDRRPFEFIAGLQWAVSTTPGALTVASAGGTEPLVIVEYL